MKPAQQKYEWGYIYGALDVVDGSGQFCYLPSVKLESVEMFLRQIADGDKDSEHVVIWDNAAADCRLPSAETITSCSPSWSVSPTDNARPAMMGVPRKSSLAGGGRHR